MPRPRKPTAALKLTGAFKKNPKREAVRAREPKPKGELGPRVEKLTALQAACWDRLVKLCPPGVLKDSDEIIVELTARLWAKLKSGKSKAADVTQLRACLQQLGMTPASRSQVQGPEDESVNEFRDV